MDRWSSPWVVFVRPRETFYEEINVAKTQVLYEKGILVTEYRNGQTPLAQETAADRLKVHRKKQRKVS